MKMMSSTRTTSTSGVTLISGTSAGRAFVLGNGSVDDAEVVMFGFHARLRTPFGLRPCDGDSSTGLFSSRWSTNCPAETLRPW